MKGKAILYLQGGGYPPFFLANIDSFMYYKVLAFHCGTASLNFGMQKLDFGNPEGVKISATIYL